MRRDLEPCALHHGGFCGTSTASRGDVAQMGEHLVRNEGVVGSNPIISTIFWARPSATRTCELRQDRKVAAVSNPSGVPLIVWPFLRRSHRSARLKRV